MSDSEPSVTFKPLDNQVSINEQDQKQPSLTEMAKKAESIEEQELTDKIEPIKANYENKAFELEDVDISNTKMSEFTRDRPGSMMSIRSSASRTSRSSVNCTTGRVKCPNLRMKKFYSYKEDGGFIRASQDIKSVILPEKDGEFIGNWLLTEINHWDLHKERVILLTEKTLFVIIYDFIKLKIYEYKRINLADIKKVTYGQLKYPNKSIMESYLYGAVKIVYGDENLSFLNRWNPSSNVPILILTSHHILYNEKEKESETYNCDEFLASLEYALSKLTPSQASSQSATIEFKEEPIEINSYASLVSVLYNQNWLGFQLDRNGVSF